MQPTTRVLASVVVLLFVVTTLRSQQRRHRQSPIVFSSETEILDFEVFDPGATPSPYFTQSGVGPIFITGTNPLLGDVNAALVFGSGDPTGGDFDLGTPNEDFDGPGIGDGGGEGSPFANATARGNLLIVGANLDDDDDDMHVDDPNDVAVEGSKLFIDFSDLSYVTFYGLTVIDIETRDPPATLELFDENERLVLGTQLTVVGDNGVTEMSFKPVERVMFACVTLNGSGAIDEIRFTPPSDGRIIGFLWDDLNKDGIQDPGEPGIPGVTVNLFETEEAAGAVATAVSDGQGVYKLLDLPAGAYEVLVDVETLPEGFRATLCGQGDEETDSNCIPAEVTMDGVEDVFDIDFGFTDDPECDGQIGNFVFYDINGNSVQDGGEPGIENAFMFLRDGDGNLVDTQTTGPDGGYLFTDLCLGDYTVEVDISEIIPPAGGLVTPLGPALCEVGFDNTVDSECGPRTVSLLTFITPDIAPDLTIDWGFGDCGDCEGGLTGLSLRFEGPFPASVPADATQVQVNVIQVNGAVVFSGMVTLGQDFSFMGANVDGTFGTFIRVQVAGETEVLLDTTCETGVEPGDRYGSIRVQAGTSMGGGFLCLPEGDGE